MNQNALAQSRELATDATKVMHSLLAYCRASNWAGYDPYDALNSAIFKAIPFLDFRFSRLAATQILKRLPINLRPLLLIPRTQNPKALALFLSASLNLSKHGHIDDGGALREEFTDRLVATRSPDSPYWCWGYSFPWQTRTVLVERGAPNLVCTTFVANALLDAYEATQEARYLLMATSTAEYILNELYWTEDNGVAGFSYPLPGSRNRVHNANFLGAALLCRVYAHSGEKKFIEPALQVARYSAGKQSGDGSWLYGEHPTQAWIDNFHTGYNLCALRSISQSLKTSDFEVHIRQGYKFFRDHFFREDGAPKYFHDRIYPIDTHSVAQSVITLISLGGQDQGAVMLAHSTFKWAMTHMWNQRQGYFYYRSLPVGTIKIPFMRWSQAWMLLALSMLLPAQELIGG